MSDTHFNAAVQAVAIAELLGEPLASARVQSGLPAAEFDRVSRLPDFGRAVVRKIPELIASGEAGGLIANMLLCSVLQRTFADVKAGRADPLDVEPILKIAARALGEANRLKIASKEDADNLPVVNYTVVLNGTPMPPGMSTARAKKMVLEAPVHEPKALADGSKPKPLWDMADFEPLPLDEEGGAG